MTQQRLRRKTSSSSSNFSDDVEKKDELGMLLTQGSPNMSSTKTRHSYTHSTNRNPLRLGKDGSQRLAISQSPKIDSWSLNKNPLEDNATQSFSTSGMRTGLGGVSYFPDYVARVSYIASVVKPDVNGDYLKDLKNGMNLLASRLAPSYFPGTIVRHITAQVDGYFPLNCPSINFSNCQDVTASIGIYLSAIPIVGEGSTNTYSGIVNSSNKNEGARTQVDPSMMTEELLAFQESLKVAIANNELQEAIRQEYHQTQDGNISPAVVIVTDTINKVDVGTNTGSDSESNDNSPVVTDNLITSDNNSTWNDKKATGNSDLFEETINDSITTIDISLGEPTISTSSIVAAEKTDGSSNVRFATGGVIGIVLISLVLVSFIAVVRRRRHGNGRIEDATIVKVQEKIKKYHGSRHSNLNDRDGCDDCDRSGHKLLGSGFIANSGSGSESGDEEEGFTGRTLRTVVSESTHSTSSHEILVQVVATSSSSCSLGTNVITEKNAGSSSESLSRNTIDNRLRHSTEKSNGERKIVDDLITKTVMSSDVRTSFENDGPSNSDKIHLEAVDDAYIGKDYEYEDDNENDFVFGEDDDSDSSVGQYLLSASKSFEFCLVPTGSPHTSKSSTCSNKFSPHRTGKEAMNSDILLSSGLGDASNCLQKLSQVPLSQSPLGVPSPTHRGRSFDTIEETSLLDASIANSDWATVEAIAAVLATNSPSAYQPPIVRGVKLQCDSLSSVEFPEFSQKEEELNRLIEAGDWHAVVVTADKYDSEGVPYGGRAIEEDASRSCQSRTSSQGSDTNHSCSSTMDNSFEGRSTSIGRSVTTSASQKERLQEIHARVVQMVRDVVPDEEENVDEMMIQFKGKEEDLLETLLTMKERIVVRKARKESQRIARRNTKPRDKTEGFESPSLSATQSPNSNEIATGEDSKIERHKTFDTDVYNKSKPNTSRNKDDFEELNTNEDYSTIEQFGYFENSTRVDHDGAAAAAAAWAIQRSLDEMM